ncbi:MAG: hypothetical protein NBV68_07555 [Erythrobacter sp.]|uniref:hypothetical protein n=1 Tax=Erythrobacter sp. TaxID=1042 RepID=UPI0025D4E9AD|nr:hypothetical protein [Erythrobacter sp.]MCL9999221.1 hypothetical protein [Erythrobacter sp.]
MDHMQLSDPRFILDSSVLDIPGPDIRAEIVKQRAEAVARADAVGIPRPPLGELVRQYQELDVARLQGR